ncbi:MAG: saccharopine dehydrogenase NADP-binding domain-containing protein [Rhodospirillales bacterium]|nr:saccharopine dehydrogenase NADP-binding domain-containing protein [Rhodospirillales bacterium]
MTPVIVLGTGKIGMAVAALLGDSGDYAVTVADRDAATLGRLTGPVAGRRHLDFADPAALRQAIAGHKMVLNACPFTLTAAIAEAARGAGADYFDLTEDVESTRAVKALADGAATAFVPQCGLAPGFVSIVAYDVARRFDALHSVQMRVGALPQFPTNALKYNLTWSTDGLINEYCNPCEAIGGGRLREVSPLEELESFSLDGMDYEAFNTSGGLGTLCETLAGKVDILNYKTVRYPGHCEIVRMLIRDLRLGTRRELLKDVLETAIPITLQDVVLVFVTVTGTQAGRLTQETYAKKIYGREIGGRKWSAIQTTTAAALCAMVDLGREGRLRAHGFVRQEETALDAFLANRFGRYYA